MQSQWIDSSYIDTRLDYMHYQKDLLENLKNIETYQTAFLGDKNYFTDLADGDHGNPQYGDGAIYIRAAELYDNRFEKSRFLRLNPKYADQISKSCWAEPGDIVFSIVGTLGKVAVLGENDRGIMSRGIAKVKSIVLPKYYVKAFMRTSYFYKELLRQSAGTVQRGVYLESLEKIPVPILKEELIHKIAQKEEKADMLSSYAEKIKQSAESDIVGLFDSNKGKNELVKNELIESWLEENPSPNN